MEPHPLEIDIIVEKVLGYVICLKDFQNCRKVCRKWDEIGLPIFRLLLKKSSVHFHSALLKDQKKWKKWKFEWWKSTAQQTKLTGNLCEYVNYLEGNPRIIFGNISISDIPLICPILQKFLRVWGQTQKHLTLNWDHKDYPREFEDFREIFRHLIFNQCVELKSLKILDFSRSLLEGGFLEGSPKMTGITELGLHYNYCRSIQSTVNFTRDILHCCPFLEKLHSDEYNQDVFLNILTTLKNSACISNLHELTLDFTQSDCLSVLSQSVLRLRRVKFTLVDAFAGQYQLLEFLNKQKNSLEYFEIGNFVASVVFLKFLDLMPKLKTLVIGNPQKITLAEMDFSITFPNLHGLYLDRDAKSDRENLSTFFNSSSEGHLKLQILEFPLVSHSQLLDFVETFPNIKELKTTCKLNGQTRRLLSLWKQIEVMDVIFIPDMNGDDNLIFHEMLTGNCEFYQPPVRIDIERLRVLKMTLWEDSIKRVPVNDVKVFRKFFNMPNLQRIAVQFADYRLL